MPRILIADDSTLSRHFLRRELQGMEYEVEEVRDGSAAWERLSDDEGPQLAILDWMMPGMDGPELCRRIRGLHRERYTYLVLLTGREGKDDLIEGLESGADDYLTKPVHGGELAARLRVACRILELENRLVEAKDELELQAHRDVLTGLPNRRAVIRALGFDDRGPQRGVVAALGDIDYFKSINDVHGHAAGDAVLVEMARRLTAAVRSGDVAGRYGGEEFLVVLAGASEATGREVAERIRVAVESRPVVWEGVEIPVTISVGLTRRESGSTESGESLLRRADAALYEAKRTGRNQVVSASPLRLSIVGAS